MLERGQAVRAAAGLGGGLYGGEGEWWWWSGRGSGPTAAWLFLRWSSWGMDGMDDRRAVHQLAPRTETRPEFWHCRSSAWCSWNALRV